MTTPPSIVQATLAVTCRGLEDRVIETTVSTATTDRMNDQITQNWDLTAYRRNPVVFWNHRTADLPIARSLWIGVVNGHLQSRDQFPPVGMYPFADIVHDMARAGFINAKSVGFKPMKWVHNEQRGGIDYVESELLEHSYVGLPANAEALISGRTADRAAVEKWLGRSSGRTKDRSDCPAGTRCPNLLSSDPCPAGQLCPMFGPAHTSWRGWRAEEPILILEDDRPDEFVLILDDDETKTAPGTQVVSFKPEDFVAALGIVIDDVVRTTANKLRGRVD